MEEVLCGFKPIINGSLVSSLSLSLFFPSPRFCTFLPSYNTQRVVAVYMVNFKIDSKDVWMHLTWIALSHRHHHSWTSFHLWFEIEFIPLIYTHTHTHSCVVSSVRLLSLIDLSFLSQNYSYFYPHLLSPPYSFRPQLSHLLFFFVSLSLSLILSFLHSHCVGFANNIHNQEEEQYTHQNPSYFFVALKRKC